MLYIITLVIGLLIGAVIGYLMEKSNNSALSAQIDLQKTHYEEMLAAKEAAHREALQTQEHHHQETEENLKVRFQETLDKVTAQMKSATDDMLKARQKEFAESSNVSLGQIVNPLRETIDKMKRAMDENTQKQTSMSGEMKASIEYMMRQSMAAKESADELARVFKHGSKANCCSRKA